MYPIKPPGQEKAHKVRRFPYVILPMVMPKEGIPEGSLFMEAIVFSLSPYPASKVLDDYCGTKGLDSSKFKCHRVVFSKDLRREGKGTLSIQRNGDGFHGRIDWRR